MLSCRTTPAAVRLGFLSPGWISHSLPIPIPNLMKNMEKVRELGYIDNVLLVGILSTQLATGVNREFAQEFQNNSNNITGVTFMSVEEKIRNYILENYLFSNDQSMLKNTDSFLQTGILDSTGILEVIHFLEDDFGVVVDDEEMVPENLDSVNNLVAYITRKS